MYYLFWKILILKILWVVFYRPENLKIMKNSLKNEKTAGNLYLVIVD